MMNLPVNSKLKKPLKLIYASTKPRCVKIFLKMDIVLIVLNASLHMAHTSLFKQVKTLRKHIELKSVNRSGRKGHVSMVSDASFCTMSQNLVDRKIFFIPVVLCLQKIKCRGKADWQESYRTLGIERISEILLIIYSYFSLPTK